MIENCSNWVVIHWMLAGAIFTGMFLGIVLAIRDWMEKKK